MFLNNLTHGIQALPFSWEWHDEKLSTALNVKESLKLFSKNQFKMFYGLGFGIFIFWSTGCSSVDFHPISMLVPQRLVSMARVYFYHEVSSDTRIWGRPWWSVSLKNSLAEDQPLVCRSTGKAAVLWAALEHRLGTRSFYIIKLCTTSWELCKTPLKYFSLSQQFVWN